ncbi:exosortase [Simiduia curdlanivorans]|uniref:Exosortase n=1 Tax=Simiduia curdlanivorans TaxID=1492769 RepID=A0ABV8V913_9GAMM|nr:exosortase [Simiduia curdlanivorans]MDN3638512.1 exosortase [Simiduia curdlanivorans]
MIGPRIDNIKEILIRKRLNFIIYLAILVTVALCYPTLKSLGSHWTKWDQALSHALPTLAMLAHFLWRLSFKAETPNNNIKHPTPWLPLLALGCSSLCWFLFQINRIELLSAIFWLALIGFYIAACFSWKSFKQLAPTLALLLFVIPIWPQLTNTLVSLSGFVVSKLISALQIPAFIENNTIQIPSGLIVIADGCSGLRYLVIAVLLAYIIGLLNRSSLKQNTWLILCSIALALFANWVRIFILILIGYHTEMQSNLMHDHELFGWAVFGAFMLPALYFAPMVQHTKPHVIHMEMGSPVIATLLLALGPLLYLLANHTTPPTNPYSLKDFQSQGDIRYVMQEVPIKAINNTSVETKKIDFQDLNVRIDLVKNIPSKEGKLVPYIDTTYDKEIWKRVDSQPVKIMMENYQISRLKHINTQEQFLLLEQFNIGKETTGNYLWAKLLQLKARALNQQYFAMIIFQTHCNTDCQSETSSLIDIATSWEKRRPL